VVRLKTVGFRSNAPAGPKCSQDTAYRDILDLMKRGALQKEPGGGRSTSYSLNIEDSRE